MSLPWLSDPRRPLTSPREIPKLEAWFDALDTRTMLAGDGTVITDGGQVALWGDKSGNSGVNCLVLPGVSGNYAGIPNPASGGIRITGNIDIRTNASMPSWAPSSSSWFVTKMFTDGKSCYDFGTQGSSSDKLVFRYTPTGAFSAIRTAVSTVGTGFSAYTKNWVRATYNSSTGSVVFYTSIDGSAWTQLGDPVALTAGLIFDGSNALQIGQGTSTYLTGQIYRVQIYASLNGTDQRLDIDFSTAAKKLANGDKFTCATGQEVTLNSSGATGARIAGERDLFQGTLANRPIWLQYAGQKYGWLNLTANNFFSTPDSAALDVTPDVEIVARVQFTDYSRTARQTVVSKYGVGAAQRSYSLAFRETDGFLTFRWTTGGSGATETAVTAASQPLTDGTTYWIKASLDGNDGAGNKVVRIDYAADTGSNTLPVSWTNVVNSSTAGTTTIFQGTANLLVGAVDAGGSENCDGKIFYASVSGTIGGAPVAIFNPSLYTSGTTFTASTGEVWTINGGAHIVTRTGLYGNGSSMYFGAAQFALTQPTTVYSVLSSVGYTSTDRVYDGATNDSGALIQDPSSPTLRAYAGAGAGLDVSTLPLKTTGASSAVFNGASSSNRINRGTPVTGNGGTGNMNGFYLFSRSAGSGPTNAFISEVAIYSAAHPTATQDRMALYEGRRHGFAV